MKLTIDGFPNLIHNKYLKIYKDIILKRKIHPVEKGEIHHIVPRSLNGSNSPENLVKLTHREHYICHLCLIKFTRKNDKYKMLWDIHCMSMKTLRNCKFNSRLYESLSQERIENLKRYLLKSSPFKNKKIHKKCMNTRRKNKSNIFLTSNPMHNEVYKKKKIEKTIGKNHYLCKRWRYDYSIDFGKTWIQIDKNLTVREICDNILFCSVSSFNYVLKGKIPKTGPLKNTIIRKIKNEN